MMKCFLPCFGANSKRTKKHSSTPTSEARTHVAEGALEPVVQLTQQNNVEEPVHCIKESKKKQEQAKREEEIPHVIKEKDDHEEGHEVSKRLHQEETSESLFSLSIDSRNQVSTEIEVNSPMQPNCTRKEEYEASVLRPLENLAQGKSPKLQKRDKETKEDTKVLIVKPEEQPDCIATRKVNPNEESRTIKKLEESNEEKGKARVCNHPDEYRYRDCCGEGYEDVNLDESDLDVTFQDDDPHNGKRGEGEEGVEDVNGTWVQEEPSESLFSLSIDSRKQISPAENVENEVNSVTKPAHVTEEEESQGRIADISSVLNPIENVTLEERVVKATVCKMSLKNDKENINSEVQDVAIDIPISPDPNLKLWNRKARMKFNDKKQEIGVDTSFSSWLVEPETTPISMNSTDSMGALTNSMLSHEDRPILGALTIEEIRKYSVSTSSTRSRSRSPDHTPIIGTVGSYWSHTGQSMDSEFNKSRKDAKIKRTSPTLKTRLERAFEAQVEVVPNGRLIQRFLSRYS